MVHRDKLREEFSARLAQACKEAGLDEHGRGMAIARALSVTSKAVSKWLNAESVPRQDKMNELAKFLRVDVFWLQHGPPGLFTEERRKKTAQMKSTDAENNVTYVGVNNPKDKYPLIDWVSAGAWCEAIEPYSIDEIDEWYETDAHVEGQAFWLRVKGDSMTSPQGLSIPEGMLVLVDTGREPKNGSLVIAKLTDANEATFKKLVIDEGMGQKYLQPLNPTHSRVAINGNCKIIGVAIETKMRLV